MLLISDAAADESNAGFWNMDAAVASVAAEILVVH
jgi:hypothetical protein